MSAEPTFPRPESVGSPTASWQTFAVGSPTKGGVFEICYCNDVDLPADITTDSCDATDEYATHIGTLTVLAADFAGEIICTMSHSCEITITGDVGHGRVAFQRITDVGGNLIPCGDEDPDGVLEAYDGAAGQCRM